MSMPRVRTTCGVFLKLQRGSGGGRLISGSHGVTLAATARINIGRPDLNTAHAVYHWVEAPIAIGQLPHEDPIA
jgi:hypothetical protein